MDVEKVIAYLNLCGAKNITERENEIRSTCPHHGGSNPTSLSVNLTTGRIHCFSCNYSGSIFDILGISSAQYPIYVEEEKEDRSDIAEAVVEYMQLSYDAPNLLKRCNNPELLKLTGTGYVNRGSYKGRTIFLYRDIEQKLQGFRTRLNRDFLSDDYFQMGSVFFMEHLYQKDGL